jgi:hypothetical protein
MTEKGKKECNEEEGMKTLPMAGRRAGEEGTIQTLILLSSGPFPR